MLNAQHCPLCSTAVPEQIAVSFFSVCFSCDLFPQGICSTQLRCKELISARSGPGMTNKSVNFVAVNKAIDMLNYI